MNVPKKRVVVGVDGSAGARRALALAAREAALRGAELDVVGVWAFPVYVDFVGGVYPLPAEVGPTIEREEELIAAEVRTVLGQAETNVTVLTPSGHPAKELLSLAEGAELLVVGSRGRGGLLSGFLGSTAAYCAHHATCPVMIVRANGTVEPTAK